MGKNVFVVTGSPRKNGNSARMAQAFCRGAAESGHVTAVFETAFRRIGGCTACDQCWTDGRACVIDDDWQAFASGLERADVVVFAYPLYWSGMPAQIKAAVDRLYAYCSDRTLRPLTGKQTVLLLCGECEGQAIFGGALAMHEGLNHYFDWKPAGMVLADRVFEAGAIDATDALARAKALGAAL